MPSTELKPNVGTVYLVGAGPGATGLITVEGVKALAAADIVIYDHLVDERLLEYARRAEKVYVGKSAGQHTLEQEDINQLIRREAEKGRCVVRLKGGDPFVFGRGGEEAAVLAEAGVPFRVVPGVTAAIGATAYAGIPLTHRDFCSTVTFVTAHEASDKSETSIDWASLARLAGTLVFYMGAKRLPSIAERLIAAGLRPETPAAFIYSGTTPRQRTVSGTLASLPGEVERAGLGAPAIVVVGEVVGLRGKLDWYERLPLLGERVLVTRARAQASELAQKLAQLGAEVIEFPLIRIEPLEDTKSFDERIRRISSYDWVIFTSVNGVEAFFWRLLASGRDARSLGTVKVAAIGPATANKLAEYGIRADCVPPKYVAESIVEELGDVTGQRFLLPRADRARDFLPEALRRRGATVDSVAAYRTVTEEGRTKLLAVIEQGIDIVTFTSSSTVESFVEGIGKDNLGRLKGVRCASIGPITTGTARKLGLEIHIEAEVHTIDGLVSAIQRKATLPSI